MITWCPVVKRLVSTEAQEQAKSCVKERMTVYRALLPNPKGLFSDSPTEPARGSKQHSSLLLTPQVSLGLLGHIVQVLEKLAHQLGLVEEPSPVPGST